tara:strand:+ start:7357 stop:8517 length:1161 start_codon:yes stop_codon:yes gene_type:complete
MNIREISKPMTAKALNESLAKRFGKKINLEAFTLEQLEDARNKLRTKLSQFETNESFDSVNTSDTYQKNKLFLDVLNAAVKEAHDENVEEKKKMPMGPGPDGKKGTDDDKPAFLDQSKGDSKDSKDSDKGDAPKGLSAKQKKLPKGLQQAIAKKTESAVSEGKGKMPSKAHVMKMCKDGKTEAEMLKMHPDCDKEKLKKLIKSCKKELKEALEGYIKLIEGKEDEAELVMAAKDMVTRVTSWMEDTAEMQTESMLELADAIRDEMGQGESDSFVGVVKPALESMYTAMESTREALTNGVGMLTGEGEAPGEDMGAEPMADAPEADADMEPTVDQDEADAAADEFAAAEPAAGGEEEAGREKRESKTNKKKMIETSRRLGSILSKKK